MYITVRFYLIVLLLSISTYGLSGGILQQKRPISDLFTTYLMQKWPNSPKNGLVVIFKLYLFMKSIYFDEKNIL